MAINHGGARQARGLTQLQRIYRKQPINHHHQRVRASKKVCEIFGTRPCRPVLRQLLPAVQIGH